LPTHKFFNSIFCQRTKTHFHFFATHENPTQKKNERVFFSDEVNKIKEEVGSRKRALSLIDKDHKLVRFGIHREAEPLT
jgi:hypothetical protein